MFRRISMIEGSSSESDRGRASLEAAANGQEQCFRESWTAAILYAHVRAELEAYARVASVGSYCVVFDTAIVGPTC